MKPQDVVAAGYDAIAERFGEWRAEIVGSPDEEWLGDLLFRLRRRRTCSSSAAGRG